MPTTPDTTNTETQHTASEPTQRLVTWAPTEQYRTSTRIWDFLQWLDRTRGVALTDYRALWHWSVTELSEFWAAVTEYFELIGDDLTGPALAEERMPGALWYPHARINYAENVLRHAADPALADTTAVLTIEEDNTTRTLTWRQLEAQVASLASALRGRGVRPGDRVAAVLPNVPEALIGLLATASLGAVWTINSPDLSATATLDRIRQLEPTVLIGSDGYRFNGKEFDRLDHLEEVAAGLPTVEHVLVVRNLDPGAGLPVGSTAFDELVNHTVSPSYERLAFDHPLWVLFSSGTTGKPKGIIHGHGGMLLEACKGTGLNQDMGPGDLYYVAANTSWMVWNTLVNNMASGAAVVTYAGSPTYGHKDRQFEVIALTGATMFGVGAAYLSLVERTGLEPGKDWDLSRLKSILSTGSPLPDSTWAWVHRAAKADVHLGSDSGGTDICSGFIGSNPLEPVHLGELQGPLLGVAVQAWNDEGQQVVGEVGEMVITRPMPSMPVRFWDDPDGSKYRAAYFEKYPGVWCQGDWITETPEGAFVVHGRSDATLNRQGVRLGSADIYAALEGIEEIEDSLVVGAEQPDGGYYMPMFVVLTEGTELTEKLTHRVKQQIRARTSVRHVPDEIIHAPAIPKTHSNKRVEVPVKKLFAGFAPEQAVNLTSLANPEAMQWFIEAAQHFHQNKA
ncbi:acetoacetate--CoA ligase [Kocuria sp. CPCC 205263]|uniref:acetoacetate--CoA ligase n=1 Tax=Kocuria sp. CPCC 205263 TaxID=3073555 RepID=UPI0034D5A449